MKLSDLAPAPRGTRDREPKANTRGRLKGEAARRIIRLRAYAFTIGYHDAAPHLAPPQQEMDL